MTRMITTWVLLIPLLAGTGDAQAATFEYGNILAIEDGDLYEYTREGTRRQVIPVEEDGDARDLIMDSQGRVHVYNGTFNPKLSTYDPTTNTWTHHSFPGWNTVNNLTYGGIGTLGRYVYVSDTEISGDSTAGIVRFDTTDYSAQRLATGDVIDLTIGLDGLLYALRRYSTGGHVVNVYDPLSLDFLHSVSVGDVSTRDLAVNADGEIFTVNLRGLVRHFDSTGTQLNSVQLGSNSTFGGDIDISSDGLIAVGGIRDVIYLTDESLESVETIDHPYAWFLYVAHVPVPEPSTLVLLAMGALGLLAYACRRRR